MATVDEDAKLLDALEELRHARRGIVRAAESLASVDETNDVAGDLDDVLERIDRAVKRADKALCGGLDERFDRERDRDGGVNREPPIESPCPRPSHIVQKVSRADPGFQGQERGF